MIAIVEDSSEVAARIEQLLAAGDIETTEELFKSSFGKGSIFWGLLTPKLGLAIAANFLSSDGRRAVLSELFESNSTNSEVSRSFLTPTQSLVCDSRLAFYLGLADFFPFPETAIRSG